MNPVSCTIIEYICTYFAVYLVFQGGFYNAILFGACTLPLQILVGDDEVNARISGCFKYISCNVEAVFK